MESQEIKLILANSSFDQWLRNEATGIFTYRENNDLKIVRAQNIEWERFDEPWIPTHLSPNTQLVKYIVKFQNNPIFEKNMLLMNGMVNIPIPFSPTNLTVRADDVNFAKIVTIDIHNSLVDNWLRNCNFTIQTQS